MLKKRKSKGKKEFSKVWISVILIISIIDINLLIFLDRMETLAVAIVTEVIGLFGGYMIKAYLGKRNEEANKLLKEDIINEEEDGIG